MFKPDGLKGWENALIVQVTEQNKEAGQAAMVKLANSERDRVLTGIPTPSSYQQFVDNVPDGRIEDVRYDGVIIFVWQYLREVVQRCFEALDLSSPFLSGNYVDNIRLLLDGDEAKAGSSLDDIGPDTRQVAIVPTADYARRLEVGLREDGSKFVIQVPLHNVEMVARMLARRYKDLADIQFNYVDVNPAWELSQHFRSRPRQAHETHVRYPAIIITARTA